MIAGQDHTLTAQERQPASRLGALACLIDDRKIEGALSEHFAIQAGERGAENRGPVEDTFDSLGLQPPRVGQQSPSLLAHRLAGAGLWPSARELTGLAEQGKGLLGQLACLARILVVFNDQVERI